MSARFEYTLARPEKKHAALLAAVERFSLKRNLSQALRYRLSVIIDELVINAIMHGGCCGENQTLSVSILDQPTELIIKIIDTGSPFDPTRPLLPRCPEKGRPVPIGGVGLKMVQHLADRIHYCRHDDRNVILLSLNKNKPEAVCSCKK